jgi:hypothetical protein
MVRFDHVQMARIEASRPDCVPLASWIPRASGNVMALTGADAPSIREHPVMLSSLQNEAGTDVALSFTTEHSPDLYVNVTKPDPSVTEPTIKSPPDPDPDTTADDRSSAGQGELPGIAEADGPDPLAVLWDVIEDKRLPTPERRREVLEALRLDGDDEEIGRWAIQVSQWWVGNPKKRKTRSGMPKFLTGWWARRNEGWPRGNGTEASQPAKLRRIWGRELEEQEIAWADSDQMFDVELDEWLAERGLRK